MPPSPAPKKQNEINRQLNRYFGLVIVVLLLVFLAAAYALVLWPKINQTREIIQSNLEQQQNIYRLGKQRLVNLRALNDIYSNVNSANLQKFNMVLPSQYPPEKLFGELEEIARRGGWLIDSIIVESDASDPVATDTNDPAVTGTANQNQQNLGKINIELGVSTIDYAGLKNFIKILETNLRIFDIQEIDFSPSDNEVKLKLVTYYYKN